MPKGLIRLLATGAAAAFLAAPAAAEPVKIRIAWAVAPAHITPLIPEAPEGVYKHYGKSYVVEPIRMNGSGPALQGLAANEIDLGGLSVQALVLGVNRAKIDLQVIAQVMSGGVEGYGSTEYYTRKGESTDLKSFKGKVIAVNALGSTIDAAVQAQFGKVGMSPGKDFQIVEVRFPAMLAALESKRVDLAPLLTPFNLIAEKKGAVAKVFDMTEALGPTETLVWIGKGDWIAKNRAALVDFLEDNMRLRAWAENPKTRPQALAVLSKLTKQPVKNYEEWAFTKVDNYRDPRAMVDVDRLAKNIADLNKLGVLEGSVDVKKHVDMSIAKDAAARLK
jgi:ABC-type nitrate/sulfonate/bicarbonate transport system substrate-binding protein